MCGSCFVTEFSIAAASYLLWKNQYNFKARVLQHDGVTVCIVKSIKSTINSAMQDHMLVFDDVYIF